MKYIAINLLTLLLVGCSTNNQQLEVTNEVSSKKIFENQDNWQPINKSPTLKEEKNNKVVK